MKPLTEKLSLWQTIVLIYIFEAGSAIVIGVGGDAKQDAWIAIFIATLIGVGIILFFSYLLSKLPGKNLFEIFEICFGKWIGKAITILYIVYFFYIAARVIRDFGELTVSAILTHTPIEFLIIVMMIVIIYIVYLGIEVLGRTAEVFIPYLLFFVLFISVSIVFTGEFSFDRIKPILPEGVGPIIKAIFPQLITFPFGELIVFMLLLPYVTKQKEARWASAIGVAIGGFVLVLSTFTEIATLGPVIRERSNFPLLSAAREISLLNFIERVDLVIVFIVMFAIVVKVSIFFYGGLKGLEVVFNKPYRVFALPMGMIVAYFSIVISASYTEHIEEGLKFVPFYLHLPMQFGIPLLLLPFVIWHSKKGKRPVDKQDTKKESTST
ncbi:spore gernimation protein KC [Bacillus sp. HMF5848]|uniref:GerAB/ArcD/ProY family transporter n=1 Tax=Bacillus sp. HMF5848 TaxID=2495421 RepID=UPI000F76D33B|nr:endospore germination permease [Bacillus sp. HMF5848]RSK25948.1 spore gernimation protein KC [Bacillus sp. HMF5848]